MLWGINRVLSSEAKGCYMICGGKFIPVIFNFWKIISLVIILNMFMMNGKFFSAYSSTYIKEPEVEVFGTGGASQSGSVYKITSTIGQPAPLTPSDSEYLTGVFQRLYSGYICNLNTRVIGQYELNVQDIDVDIDTDSRTQVAGVYFPLSLIAYDGYGQVAKSDSGTSLTVTLSSATGEFDTDGDGTFGNTTVSLSKGQWPPNDNLSPTHTFNSNFQTYDTTAVSNFWIKGQDERGKSASLSSLTIQPAWINRYTLTTSSPQHEEIKWAERIFAWDVYGNQVHSWENLTGHITPQLTVSLAPEFAEFHQDMDPDPFKLYENIDSAVSSNEQIYSLSSEGKAFIYVKDDMAETIQLQGLGNAYEYSALKQSIPSYISKIVNSGTIIVLSAKMAVAAQFFYDRVTGKLKISGWLEREEGLITEGLEGGEIKIYNSQGQLLNTLSGSINGQSVYEFSWPDANLTETVYNVRLTIRHNQDSYASDIPFELDLSSEFAEIIQELSVRTPQIKAALQETEEEISQLIEEEYMEDIKENMAKVLVAAEKTLPAQIKSVKDVLMNDIKARIFNTPTIMKIGKKYLVNFQTYSGVSPVLDMYDPKGELLIEKRTMTEVDDSGVYQLSLTLENTWVLGTYTLVCSESAKGTMDAASIIVTSTDLETIDQNVGSLMGAFASGQDMSAIRQDIEKAFDIFRADLEKLLRNTAVNIDESLTLIIESEGNKAVDQSLADLYDGLVGIKNKFKEAGVVPLSLLDSIVSFDDSRKKDIAYIKQKFTQVQTISRLQQQMLDNLINEPIIETWYEFR